MTIVDLTSYFSKFFKNNNKDKKTAITLKNYLQYILYVLFLGVIFLIFASVSNYIDKKKIEEKKEFKEFIKTKEFSFLEEYFANSLKSPYREIQYVIKNNDSIEGILNKLNIKNNEIQFIASKLKEMKLTNIYAGRKLLIVIKNLDEDKSSVVNIIYPVTNTISVEIRKNQENFSIKKNILKLYKKDVIVKNYIENNLYSSATKVGLEPNIIIEFARIYGFEIDFQRDIRKGDMFEIAYEKFVDDDNVVRDTGKITYASMKVNNREIILYNFKYKNEIGYYDINGKSIVKSLMKTPINGARLSSSFGNRKHPILGYTKLHTGTDFAAPSGTPIMASGSGTVTRSRWCGGGGNCIKIRHNSIYETVYAHLKSFAKGIKEGKKVKQGQIIGYVGSTGMSTGPHLHYEVHINKKKVNSQKLKLPSGKVLKGDARKDFEIERIKIDLKLSELRANN